MSALAPDVEIKQVPNGFKLSNAQDRAMDVLRSDATHIALGGGSRSGKTFLMLRAVIMRALRSAGSRHVVFRFRFNHLKSSVVLETLPKVMQLCFPGLADNSKMDKVDWYITLPNGSEIWFCGLDDKERTEKVLGKEYATVWFNECSQIPYPSIIIALSRLAQKTECLRLKAYYDFNPPSANHWTYRQFIEKKDPNSKQALKEPHDYGFYLINPIDNIENLDPAYMKILDAMPKRQRDRFLLGKFGDASEGQLWTSELLSVTRVLNSADVPAFLRVVVAVDPSGCSGPEDTRSDEIGIIVAALGQNGQGYILEDLSGRYGPADWGQIVVDAYNRHKADRVIGESNFGGAMVEACVRAAEGGFNLPYQDANATRGKIVRAEPISGLYERNKVHHYGHFPELEDQMCSMTTAGYTGLKSPDRADALVWALTVLFPAMAKEQDLTPFTPPKVNAAPRNATRYSRNAVRR